jgi:hypothetical protein
MIVIGVDPGKSGGIVELNSEKSVLLTLEMPVIQGRSGSRPEHNIAEIADLFDRMKSAPSGLFVFVEKSQPMPPHMPGGIAQFERGVARGWAWLLAGLRISHELVAPQTWQKVMLAGTPGTDTKQKALVAAQRLFPGVDLRASERCRKPHSGIVDALLIAEWGRRKLAGGGA